MAGFEVIVRPAVLPNIRPPAARALAPEENPEQDMVVMSGGGASLITLTHSFNVSVSHSSPKVEAARQFDTERVHQVEKDGTINKDNYVEVERAKKIRLNSDEGAEKLIFKDPPARENVEVIETDMTRSS